MEMKGQSPHVGRAGEGAENRPVRRETEQTIKQQDKGRQINRPAGDDGSSTNPAAATSKAVGRAGEDGEAINKEREPETTTPRTDRAGERAADKPKQSEDSAASEKVESNMELETLQQILLALERQRTENAEREAARARENAERDAAMAREIAELRADNAVLRGDFEKFRADVTKQLADQSTKFVDRDAARGKETADLRVENAETTKAMITEIAELKVLMAQQSRNTLFMLAAAVAILGGLNLFLGS